MPTKKTKVYNYVIYFQVSLAKEPIRGKVNAETVEDAEKEVDRIAKENKAERYEFVASRPKLGHRNKHEGRCDYTTSLKD